MTGKVKPSRPQRERKTRVLFQPTEKLRVRTAPPSLKAKSKRRPCAKSTPKSAHKTSNHPVKKRKVPDVFKNFFKPKSKKSCSSSSSPTADRTKDLVQQVVTKLPKEDPPPRRLRSTAPIYQLIDKIAKNHPGKLKHVDPYKYVCNCGAVFATSSYRKLNFLKHLAKDERRAKTTPWTRSQPRSSTTIPPLTKPIVSQPLLQPSVVCDGFWLRKVDGVEITDRYHVRVSGKNGFYGVPRHRSHRETVIIW